MAKSVKRILVLAVIFTMTIVNYGLPLQAIAAESGSIFNFAFFRRNEIALDAYFNEDSEKEEEIKSVNDTAKITLEVSPLIEGYLKSGSLKFNLKNGNVNNFKLESATIEEKEELELDETDTLMLEEAKDIKFEEEKEENVVSNEVVDDIEEEKDSGKVEEKVEESKIENEENIKDSEKDKNSLLDVLKGSGVKEVAENIVSKAITEMNTENKVEESPVTEESKKEEAVKENEQEESDLQNVEEVDKSSEEISEDMEEKDIFEEAKECYEVNLASENEIALKNIIDTTKIFVELSYKQSEKINPEDLLSEIEIILEGDYINKKLETLKITKKEELTLGWEYSKEVKVTSEIEKVSPFTVGKNAGTIIENVVTVERKIEDDNSLPIKETNIKIEIPKINDKLPIAVNVAANKLMATLGKELTGKEFTKNNWIYDEETGILEIKVVNEEKIVGSGVDKFDIICRYEDYYEAEKIILDKKVEVIVEEYSANENKIQEIKIEENQEKEVVAGELMSYAILENEETIGKGKINANYYVASGETRFSSKLNVTVLTSDILDEVLIQPEKETYKTKDGVELDASMDVKYAGVKFNLAEIKEMLGQGTTIDLLDGEGNVFHTITNDVDATKIEFANKIDNVKVRVNNVKVNGNLSIEFVKTIERSQYTINEFSEVEIIQNSYKAEVKYVGFEDIFQLPEIKDELKFTNTITQVNLLMNRTQLSTIYENNNVEFKIDLINNLETSDIYKNPTFELVFPVFVKEVKINNIYTLYQNGLSLRDYQVVNENGRNKVIINLEGVQNGYNFSDITNGTNIILNTNIVLDDITPQKQDQVELYYCNEAVTSYQTQTDWKLSKLIPEGILSDKNGYDATGFVYQSPAGMHTINAIINYDGTGRTIKSFNQGEIIKTIPIKGESSIATMELSVLNNTGHDCTNVVLIGRIPFKGNTDVKTGKDLGTNFNALMKSFIIQDEVTSNSGTIYYSTNPNADNDLTKESNGWISEVSGDRDNIKSYMIVIDGIFKQGGILKYKYDFEIPANLGYEVKMLGSFGVFYNSLSSQKFDVADKVGLITEAGAKLDATMSVDIGDGAEIGETKYLKYKIKVENTGSINLSNVVIESVRPDHIWFCEVSQDPDGGNDGFEKSNSNVYTYTIPELKVGQKVETEIVAKAKEIPETLDEYFGAGSNVDYDNEKEQYFIYKENGEIEYITEVPKDLYITNYATVYVDGTAKGYETNKVTNKLVHSKFDIETTMYKDVERLEAGNQFQYVFDVANISGETLKDIVIEGTLPREVSYLGIDEKFDVFDVEYDKETNDIKFNIGELENRKGIRIYITCCIDKFKNIGESKISNFITVKAENGIEEKSTIVTRPIYGAEFLVTQDIKYDSDKIYEYEKFQLLINLRNNGKAASKEVNFEIDIPKGLEVINTSSESDYPIPMETSEEKVIGRIPTLEVNSEASIIINLRSEAFGEGEENRSFGIHSKVSEAHIGNLSTENLEFIVYDNPDREMTEEEKKEEEKEDIVVDPTIGEDYKNDIEDSKKEDEENKNNNNQKPNDESANNQPSNDKQEENRNEEKNPEPPTIEENVNDIKTYKITGKVWKDENKNNAKDSNEAGVGKVNVRLFEGDVNIKSTVTDSLGKYSFTEIPQGKYTIVFEYDKKQYIASKYRLNNVVESENSDAIEAEEGVAVTEVIDIRDTNVEINMGLQTRDNFDMTVQKYISKAIVNTNGKEKVYTYNNDSIAKLEIRSKEMKNTTIQLEYKIVISNEGDVNGTIGRVEDYLPELLKFDEKLNKDWKKDSNDVIYNESLTKEIIKPGESRELKLVLNKVMTNNNTGTISNKVKIDKLSSDKALNENNENNIATQEMIVTVSTGRTIGITTMIVLIIMATFVIYGIKTGKIKKSYK